jgi:rod shape-determining protein MreD
MITKLFRLTKLYSFSTIPTLTLLFSVILIILPYKSHNMILLMPFIGHIVIYFWTIYRPQMLPYSIIFIIGLIKDILESNVLGLSSLSFLLFKVIINTQRKHIYNNNFIVVWAGFIFYLSLILLLPLLLSKCGANINYYPFIIIFIQWLITILVYVPIHWLLNKLNNLSTQT